MRVPLQSAGPIGFGIAQVTRVAGRGGSSPIVRLGISDPIQKRQTNTLGKPTETTFDGQRNDSNVGPNEGEET